MKKPYIIYALLILVIGVGFFIFNNAGVLITETEDGIACALDAKLCQDGTYVSRVTPSCEFAKCPTGEEAPPPQIPEPLDNDETVSLTLLNQGGRMEGHTPRGFQGSGTGLFAGDNLNPNFPNGDGVQIFLSFHLGGLPEGTITSATLRSGNSHIQGTPFTDLGALNVEEIRYQTFYAAVWSLKARGDVCVFATSPDGPFACDVTQVLQNSQADSYPFAQFRILFDKAGDNDGSPDMVEFYKTNSNVNTPGIFELELTIDKD